ncbi:hypothetical protein T459_08654 [Capsicum annuum]|uniref:Glutamate synthase alpha subunit C-terminal domain-containing protein n=1 Tax=Capsicum annuum TaxID=4072 RepID=A0A2G2ZX54_CAPAN|nr:hypothetical protein T459_08654 [Capsicum annuum]
MLAQLGYEKLDDIIGHTDILRPRDISLMKTRHLDLSYILSNVGLPEWSSSMIRNQEVHSNGPVLDDVLLADPKISDAIENEKVVNKTVEIYNIDRAVCGRIAGAVAKKYGDTGFAGQLNIIFTGSAGQSFACFLTPGMNIRLIGEANDYVGKGMAGGELVVTPVENTGFCPEDATIVGNTCLYGATGGQVFVKGKAGERFAVRNSLAQAVVEGTGDHCCEYMTGGCVVVLGKVGRNVAAGMTGGLAYILDEDETLIRKVNKEIVKIQRVVAPVGQMQLKNLIEAHVEKTGSTKGSLILKDWDKYLPLFWQLVPPSEEDTPEASAEYEQAAVGQGKEVTKGKDSDILQKNTSDSQNGRPNKHNQAFWKAQRRPTWWIVDLLTDHHSSRQDYPELDSLAPPTTVKMVDRELLCMPSTRRSGAPLLPICPKSQLIGRMADPQDAERLAALARAQLNQQNDTQQARHPNPDDDDLRDDDLLDPVNPRRKENVAAPVNLNINRNRPLG